MRPSSVRRKPMRWPWQSARKNSRRFGRPSRRGDIFHLVHAAPGRDRHLASMAYFIARDAFDDRLRTCSPRKRDMQDNNARQRSHDLLPIGFRQLIIGPSGAARDYGVCATSRESNLRTVAQAGQFLRHVLTLKSYASATGIGSRTAVATCYLLPSTTAVGLTAPGRHQATRSPRASLASEDWNSTFRDRLKREAEKFAVAALERFPSQRIRAK